MRQVCSLRKAPDGESEERGERGQSKIAHASCRWSSNDAGRTEDLGPRRWKPILAQGHQANASVTERDNDRSQQGRAYQQAVPENGGTVDAEHTGARRPCREVRDPGKQPEFADADRQRAAHDSQRDEAQALCGSVGLGIFGGFHACMTSQTSDRRRRSFKGLIARKASMSDVDQRQVCYQNSVGAQRRFGLKDVKVRWCGLA